MRISKAHERGCKCAPDTFSADLKKIISGRLSPWSRFDDEDLRVIQQASQNESIQKHRVPYLLKTPCIGVYFFLVACGGGGGGDPAGGVSNAPTTTPSYTVTAAAGANGSLTPSNVIVQEGDTTSFTVTPDSGFTVDTISGCNGTLTGNIYATGPIAANCAVSADFRVPAVSYTVTATAGANGSISPDSVVVGENDTTRFTVTPDSGFSIDSVKGCNGTLTGTVYTTGPVTVDCAVSASFRISPISYTVTVTTGANGSISPGSVVVGENDSTSFTVVPDSGFAVGTIRGCGGNLVGNTYTTAPITNDCSVTASFVAVYMVSAIAGPNGSVDPASIAVIEDGTTAFTVTPDGGFSIETVDGCGGTLTGKIYTTGPITADCTVTATFIDVVAPQVIRTAPADKATAVERVAVISARFSEPILAKSVDSATMTLENNGGAVAARVDFDVASDTATLTPTSRLRMLGEYTTTVTTGVTDLSGNPLSADFQWSFTTRDGRWQGTSPVENNNTGGAFAAQLAVDKNGDALAVWRQWDGARYNIWSNLFTPDNGWSNAKLVETDNIGGAITPQIAFDPNGNAMAVWSQSDGIQYSVWANRYKPGSGWGVPELVEEEKTGGASDPQIAIDASGNALVVWKQSDSNGVRRVWANRSASGARWNPGAAELIENGAGTISSPQIAFDSSGNAMAVWSQWDGTRYNIWANLNSPIDGWDADAAKMIEADNEGDAYTPQIAFDVNGNALAVWYQFDRNGKSSIWANRYSSGSGPGSGWHSAEKIEADDTGNVLSPQIAIGPDGDALVVWSQSRNGGTDNIWSNRYTAGSGPNSGWNTNAAQLIETVDTGDASSPQIAFDPEGNALAVWYQTDGTRYDIWANRYIPGRGWGTAELIEFDKLGDAENPQIAIDSSGNALAVWEQSDGAINNIVSNRFK